MIYGYHSDRNTQAYKAVIGGVSLYFSYSTLIGANIPGEGRFRTRTTYSNTTARHMREFNIRDAEQLSEETLQERVLLAIYRQAMDYIETRMTKASPK